MAFCNRYQKKIISLIYIKFFTFAFFLNSVCVRHFYQKHIKTFFRKFTSINF